MSPPIVLSQESQVRLNPKLKETGSGGGRLGGVGTSDGLTASPDHAEPKPVVRRTWEFRFI